MKKIDYLIVSLLLFLSAGLFLIGGDATPVRADSTSASSTYTLHIVKYKLTDSQLKNSTLPKTAVGTPVTGAKDASGNTLTLMSGVTYQIVQVQATNNSTTPFEQVPGTKTQTITTDSQGQATVTLPAGIYQVTEQAGAGIQTPAAPVIVQLPLTLQNGQVLNSVYLYPKSSVVSLLPNTPGHPNTPGSSEPSIIPHTAGDIASPIPLYVLLGFVVIVGIYGLFVRPKKL